MTSFPDIPANISDVVSGGDLPSVDRRSVPDRRRASDRRMPESGVRYTGPERRSGERRRHGRRAGRPRVSVVIPAMNEADNLPHVFSRLPAFIDEVVLVDGHSTDDTIAVARALRPDVRVVTQTHRGKGNALACGFAMCSGDIIIMLDADGSTDPGEIPLFVAELLDGADFVKGSRYMTDGGSEDLTRARRYGNAVLTGTVNVLFRTRYTDLCYGYMAFWRRCLPQLSVDCTGFEIETLLTLRAARAGLKVVEVPSVERLRVHGESNLRPVHDGLRVLRTITGERLARDRTAQTAPAWAALTGALSSAAPDLAHHVVEVPARMAQPELSDGSSTPGEAQLMSGQVSAPAEQTAHQLVSTSSADDLLVIVPSAEASVWAQRRVSASGARVIVLPTR